MKKACTGCGKELPTSAFHRDSRAKDGRRSRCASCISRANAAACKRPPVVDPSCTRKECPRCREVLPVEDFGMARRMLDGKNSWCKTCCSEATRAWQQTATGRRKHAEAVKRYREKKRRVSYGVSS